MFNYNVTVKTKNSPQIVINVEHISNIVYGEYFLTLYKNYNRYRFSNSEIEYYFVERIVYDED